MGQNRRGFLGRLAALAAAFALPRSLSAEPEPTVAESVMFTPRSYFMGGGACHIMERLTSASTVQYELVRAVGGYVSARVTRDYPRVLVRGDAYVVRRPARVVFQWREPNTGVTETLELMVPHAD